jgi:hypothetical protein
VAEVDLVDLMVVMDMHQVVLLTLPMEAAVMVEIMAVAEAVDGMDICRPPPQQEPEVRVQYVWSGLDQLDNSQQLVLAHHNK